MKKSYLVIVTIVVIAVVSAILCLMFCKDGHSNNPEKVLKSYYAKVEQNGAASLQKYANNFENLTASDKQMLETYVDEFQSFIKKHKGIKSIENITSKFIEPMNEEVVISFTIIYNDDYKENMTQRLVKVKGTWKVVP